MNTRAALEKRQRCNRAAPEECGSSARAFQEQHRSSARSAPESCQVGGWAVWIHDGIFGLGAVFLVWVVDLLAVCWSFLAVTAAWDVCPSFPSFHVLDSFNGSRLTVLAQYSMDHVAFVRGIGYPGFGISLRVTGHPEGFTGNPWKTSWGSFGRPSWGMPWGIPCGSLGGPQARTQQR